MRLGFKQTAVSGLGSLPANRPADLEAFGLRALDAVGARLALLFLVTALAGTLLGAGTFSDGPVVLTCAAVLACMLVVAAVLPPGRATPWALALVVAGAAAAFLLAGPPAGITWDQSGTLAAWVVAGLSSGVAAARGPAWGLAVSLPVAVTYLMAGRAHQHTAPALLFLGALTYLVGGACTNVLARRGFAGTERALEAVAAAEAARQVAEERWQARCRADRVLHDTVLATLTVLAHQGVGVEAGEIRAACARDLATFAEQDQDPVVMAAIYPAEAPARPLSGDALERIIAATTARATALGLEPSVHISAPAGRKVLLDETTTATLIDALAACVTNIRVHAGVTQFDIVVRVAIAALLVLVLDKGCGFEVAAIPEDRLGLRASVAEPLAAVGGSMAVWSQPGEGTSVRLWLPLPGTAL